MKDGFTMRFANLHVHENLDTRTARWYTPDSEMHDNIPRIKEVMPMDSSSSLVGVTGKSVR